MGLLSLRGPDNREKNGNKSTEKVKKDLLFCFDPLSIFPINWAFQDFGDSLLMHRRAVHHLQTSIVEPVVRLKFCSVSLLQIETRDRDFHTPQLGTNPPADPLPTSIAL